MLLKMFFPLSSSCFCYSVANIADFMKHLIIIKSMKIFDNQELQSRDLPLVATFIILS